MSKENNEDRQDAINIPQGLNLNDQNIKKSDISNLYYLNHFRSDLQNNIYNDPNFSIILKTLSSVIQNYLVDKQMEKENELGKNANKQVSASHKEMDTYAVIIINEVLLKARLNNLDIVCCNKTLYQYTGKFYRKIEDDYIRSFLELAAIATGLDSIFASIEKFNDILTKQLIVSSMKSEPVLSKDEVRINLKNGVYCVQGNKHFFRAHDKEDFFRYILPFDYDKDADCLLFEEYLNRVLPDISSQNNTSVKASKKRKRLKAALNHEYREELLNF